MFYFNFRSWLILQRRLEKLQRLKAIAINRLSGIKIPVDIDPQSGRASGPNGAKFGSYLGVLARSKVSILVPDWDHVTEEEKDLIWQDLCVSNKFIGYNNYIINSFVFCLMTYLFIFANKL